MRSLKKLIFLLIIVFNLQNCSKESLNETDSTTTISVKLNGTNSQYEEVWIEITDVLIKVIDNESIPNCWISLKSADKEIYKHIDITSTEDLNLTTGINIPSGIIYELKLVIGEGNSLVINGKSLDLNTNAIYQSESASRIEKNLKSNNHYRFNLEFDTDNSILESPIENYYILQPSIRTTMETL